MIYDLPDVMFAIPMTSLGGLIGNSLSDNATLKDCATKHEAKLFNGATIECKVRESPRDE